LPIDVAEIQEIKDMLAAAAAAVDAMSNSDFLMAAENGDLAKVKLAVEKHKLDPNCSDVSAPTPFPLWTF